MYKVLDMDRKYVVNKCNEWMRSCDTMYMEVGEKMGVNLVGVVTILFATVCGGALGLRGVGGSPFKHQVGGRQLASWL
jgi:hypothetical protein